MSSSIISGTVVNPVIIRHLPTDIQAICFVEIGQPLPPRYSSNHDGKRLSIFYPQKLQRPVLELRPTKYFDLKALTPAQLDTELLPRIRRMPCGVSPRLVSEQDIKERGQNRVSHSTNSVPIIVSGGSLLRGGSRVGEQNYPTPEGSTVRLEIYILCPQSSTCVLGCTSKCRQATGELQHQEAAGNEG